MELPAQMFQNKSLPVVHEVKSHFFIQHRSCWCQLKVLRLINDSLTAIEKETDDLMSLGSCYVCKKKKKQKTNPDVKRNNVLKCALYAEMTITSSRAIVQKILPSSFFFQHLFEDKQERKSLNQLHFITENLSSDLKLWACYTANTNTYEIFSIKESIWMQRLRLLCALLLICKCFARQSPNGMPGSVRAVVVVSNFPLLQLGRPQPQYVT